MRVLKSAIRVIDRVNAVIASIASWAVVALVLSMTYEVVARYVFRSPTLWSYDVSYFLNSFMVMMGAAYTLSLKGHVNVDVIYGRLSPRGRALLDLIFSFLLFFPLWVPLLRTMLPHLQYSWSTGERALTGTWLPPIYPFKTWVWVGIALLTIQGVAEVLRCLITLFGREQEQ